MPHRGLVTALVIDVPFGQHADEVAFWSATTGLQLAVLSSPEFHGVALTPSLALVVQEVGDGAARVHLDIHTDDVAAEQARLEVLGATALERHDHWVVMRDPAGLPFCVVEARPGSLDGDDLAVWP
jgi:hypothetical protein